MKISYCDTCATPLKGKVWVLKLTEYYENPPFDTNKLPQTLIEKDICDDCKKIIEDFLAGRMERLSMLAEEIRRIHEMPTKKNPLERKGKKNGKEKK